MDTLKLRHFCALVESGSLSRAAQVCGISHPGIHKSLKALEQELQITLTRPEGRGIIVTQEGFALYEKAKQILRSVEELHAQARAPSSAHIRIGLAEVFCFDIPTDLLKQDKLKHLRISFHERCPGDIETQVAMGKIDFGFTTHPIAAPGLDHIELGQIEFGLFSIKSKLNLDQLTYIVPNSLFNERPRDHWPEELIPRVNTIGANMLSIALELVRTGHGAVYIPKFLAKLRPYKLVEIKVPEKFNNKVPCWFVRRINLPETEVEHVIKKTITQTIGSPSSDFLF